MLHRRIWLWCGGLDPVHEVVTAAGRCDMPFVDRFSCDPPGNSKLLHQSADSETYKHPGWTGGH